MKRKYNSINEVYISCSTVRYTTPVASETVCLATILAGQEIKTYGNYSGLPDDALFTSTIQPDNLPVGSSSAPHDRKNVWTWDNHGRYLVGSRWTADELRIRRLDELDVK